ncbi:MAG: hypothetical protein HOY78_42570 [Saccharothrix sp.]|nr:hypothetical protein [Saccharothrix sp.]
MRNNPDDRDGALLARLAALGPAQRAALRARLAQAAGVPLTATQEGMWLAEQLDAAESGYHDVAVLRVDGPLDEQALRTAFADLVGGFEALRCRVAVVDDAPRQFFDVAELPWRTEDLTAVPPERRDRAVARVTAVAAATRFTFAEGPLWRIRLVRLTAHEHVLVVVLHHLITDGWSLNVLLGALLTAYRHRLAGQAPPAPEGAPYEAWLRARCALERAAGTGPRLAEAVRALGTTPRSLALPGLRPTGGSRRATSVAVPVPAPGWATFGTACGALGTTRFMALAGLFARTLARAADVPAVTVSAPVANRHDHGTAGLLGCLVGLTPLVVAVPPGTSAREAVLAGRSAVSAALDRSALPYRDLARALGASAASDDPLTNVGLDEFNAPTGSHGVGDLVLTPLPRQHLRLRHDLTLSVPSDPAQVPELLYPEQRWSPGAVRDLAEALAGAVLEVANG